ncbi:PEP/pyruvate-binding domain-containing protein [Microbispora sp. NPDC049125]|uniref:PEP/pyruvate-binding domain-containing protein n=1 Tax=Microbispora sp. NPDC049125 TaxID=3154929 RepID=UPI0034670A51
MKHVLALREIGLDDAPRVGRKAAVLGELKRAGFPVPDGWAVVADALDEAFGRERPPNEAVPNEAVPNEAASDAAASRDAASGDAVAGLRDELAVALAALGGTPVAVRSSGIAEDLEGMSFAGQYESVLDVRGLDAVVDAVRSCWASGASERVAAYRGDSPAGQVGVLIQVMVPADAAGAAFSVNPLTGDPGEIVISAVRGLGERLMAGEATADEWTVRDGEATRTSGAEDAVTAEQAGEIAALTACAAGHFGAPQDVEWALSGGVLWLLQARPITALAGDGVPHVPIPVEVPPGFSVPDRNTDRPWTPIERSVYLPAIAAASPYVFAFTTGAAPTVNVIGGWPYITNAPDTATAFVSRLEKIAVAVAGREPERLVELWNAEWKPRTAAAIARLRAADLARLGDKELAEHTHEVKELFAGLHDRYFRLTGAAIALLGRLGVACEELLGWDPQRTLRLRGGLTGDHVPATAALGDLARLAAGRPAVREALEDGRTPEAPEFTAAFEAYVRDYGHRTIGFTLTEPTLAERPEILLSLVRAQLDAPYDLAAERVRLAERRDAAVREAREALAGRPAADRERFEAALAGSDLSGSVRDEKVFYAVSVWALLRAAALELGTRLRGRIADPGDVFFLELDEALAALEGRSGDDLAALVRHRRGEHAWALAHPGPPFYGDPPTPLTPEPGMTPPSEAAMAVMHVAEWSMGMLGGRPGGPSEDGAVRGLAASAGRYVGPARVITSVADFGKLRRGDVLVCPETTAQWALLFPSVGALVADRGSLLSHPAIIAREYGVHAVVATGTATTAFRDDQLLVVDGTAGTVRPATPQ